MCFLKYRYDYRFVSAVPEYERLAGQRQGGLPSVIADRKGAGGQITQE